MIEEIVSLYSFTYSDKEYSHIICRCGNHIKIELEQDEEDVVEFTEEDYQNMDGLRYMVAGGLTKYQKMKCDSCGNNFFSPNEKHRLLNVGTTIATNYSIESSENSTKLISNTISSKLNDKNTSIELINSKKELLVLRDESNDVSIQMIENGSSSKIDLTDLVDKVNEFFKVDEFSNIIDTYNIHLFVMELTRYVYDSKKLSFIEDFFSPLRNRINDAGMEFLAKAVINFFSIILYPNLSTLALTKGSKFMTDMVVSCELPSVVVLKERSVTKPLDIFNALSESYLKKIRNEISKDSNSVKEFNYVNRWSKEEMKIKVRDQKKLDKMNSSRVMMGKGEKGGKGGVIESIKDGTITKYIFDTLRTFSDYENLIKMFKFYDKKELTSLLMKYEIDYLINFIQNAYWRDKVSDIEFNRMYHIIKDYVKLETRKKRVIYEGVNEWELKEDDFDFSLMSTFDFTIYDDSISMLMALKDITSGSDNLLKSENDNTDMFDRSRYFDKIRDWKSLKNFHDSLAAQYRLVKIDGLEKNTSYYKFVNKYEWLEKAEGYSGPIKVELLRTLSDFIKEGNYMMSSQAQYGSKVSQGIYLVARLVDISESEDKNEEQRLTIGFTVDRKGGLEFDQLKGKRNAQASNRIKGLVRSWLEKMSIPYDEMTTDIRYRGERRN